MSDKTLDEYLVDMRRMQDAVNEYTEALEVIRDHVISLMGARTEHDVKVDGKQYKVYRVAAVRKLYNGARLSTLLKDQPDLLDEVTERKVVPGEFERRVRMGDIDQSVVDEVFTTRPTVSYMRFVEQE